MRRLLAAGVAVVTATGIGMACSSFSGNDNSAGSEAGADGNVPSDAGSPAPVDAANNTANDAGDAGRWDCEGLTHTWDPGTELIPAWIDPPTVTTAKFKPTQDSEGSYGRFTQSFEPFDGGPPPGERYNIDFTDAGTSFVCTSVRVRTYLRPASPDVVEEFAGGFFTTEQSAGAGQFAVGAMQAGSGLEYVEAGVGGGQLQGPVAQYGGDPTKWHVLRFEMHLEDGGMRLTFFVDGEKLVDGNPFPASASPPLFGVVGFGPKTDTVSRGAMSAIIDYGDVRIDVK